MMTKKILMDTIRQLVASNMSVEDAEAVLILKKQVESIGSTLPEVAELAVNLTNLGVQLGEIGAFVKQTRDLKDQRLTPSGVKTWTQNDEDLVKQGFDRDTRKLMLEGSVKFGGAGNCILAAMRHGRLDEILRDEAVAERRLDETNGKLQQQDAILKANEVALNNLASARMLGWDEISMAFAPEVLRRVNTVEKRRALAQHLLQYTWYQVPGGEARLVETKRVYQDPVEMAKTLRELRQIHRGAPFSSGQLVELSGGIMEKLPGLTFADYAHFLLMSPDVSEDEKTLAKYLQALDVAARKAIGSGDQEMLVAENLTWKMQNAALKMKHADLVSGYPTPEQREAYDKSVCLATNNLPPDADLLEYGKLMTKMMGNLAEAAGKNEELSDSMKDAMEALSNYCNIFEKIEKAEKIERSNIRQGEPTGGSNDPQGGDEDATTPLRSVDYDTLNKIDEEARKMIIQRILGYAVPPYDQADEICGEIKVDGAAVKTMIDYLVADPGSRVVLRLMGYTNSQLPGWVIVLPIDKFAGHKHA